MDANDLIEAGLFYWYTVSLSREENALCILITPEQRED